MPRKLPGTPGRNAVGEKSIEVRQINTFSRSIFLALSQAAKQLPQALTLPDHDDGRLTN
jgi:hypothetical protein